MARAVLWLALVAFSVLTGLALWHHGLWGILAPHFQSLAGGQVFADLVIALCLAIAWIWHDAKTHQRNPWPWMVATLALGSIGPLVYLLARPQGASLR